MQPSANAIATSNFLASVAFRKLTNLVILSMRVGI
jgi:hypothetical protein